MKKAFIATAVAFGLIGGGLAAADGIPSNNGTDMYVCLNSANQITHSYPLNGWHGNKCAAGETIRGLKGVPVPVPPTDPPTTTPPTTDPPTTTPPPAGDFPNASNTGVQPGVQLTNYTGTDYITTAGTTIENKAINGDITIKASNVTLRNVKIFGHIKVDDYNPDVSGVLLSHIEVDGQGSSSGNGINEFSVGGPYGGGFTLEYANIHGFETGVTINSDFDKTIVRESYIHDLGPSSSDHKAGISANSAGNADIIHNNVDCEVGGCSASIALYGDFGQIKDWNVLNNLFNTEGSYCSYSGSLDGKNYPVASNVQWKNNTYGHEHNSQCGQYGYNSGWSSANGNVWSGNKTDTGAVVNP